MPSITRAIGIAVVTTGLALAAATTADAANKVLMVNGLGAGDLSPLAMGAILGGAYGGSNYVRENVSWPAQAKPVVGKNYTLTQSIDIGAKNLDAAISKSLANGDTVTVIGLSAGALVVDQQIAKLDAQAVSPDKSKLSFVVIADSSRCNFNKNRYDATIGYQYKTPVESKYNVTVVTGQYDGYADFPDRPNPTAIANAMAGSQIVHIPSMLAPLSAVPKSNITVKTNPKGGVTTSYLVPTKTLPLVTLNPKLAPQEAALRKTVDSAYIRNDPKAVAAAAEAPATQVSATAAAAAPRRAAQPVRAAAGKSAGAVKAAAAGRAASDAR